ncbi:MAG: Ger(x)C family spore germination protein [Desulfosporosinus sp.]|jgi:spore germination protein KC
MKGQRNMKFKIGFILLLLVSQLFFNGCGKREVEELAPLLGLGIDLGKEPGSYLVTYQFLLPRKSGEAGAEIQGQTISVESTTAREADEKISKIFSRKIFMGSLRVIVISEDVAKGGFLERMDFEQRFSEFRRLMFLVIAKGKAQDILNVDLRTGKLPVIYIKESLETAETISTFPAPNIGQFFTVISQENMSAVLPVIDSIESGEKGIEYKTEDNSIGEFQFEGAAVFRGDRMVDFLTDIETKGYMWLENKVVHRFLNTQDIVNSKISFSGQVLNAHTQYLVSDKDGKVKLQYKIKASIAVEEVKGLKKQLSPPEWVDLMEEAETIFAEAIRKECELAIQKEKELGLDFLKIGRHIEQYKPAYWKTVKDQWAQKIVDFPLSLTVEVKLDHSGMASSSPTVN